MGGNGGQYSQVCLLTLFCGTGGQVFSVQVFYREGPLVIVKVNMPGTRQHIKTRNYKNFHCFKWDPFKRDPLWECSFYLNDKLYHLISIINHLVCLLLHPVFFIHFLCYFTLFSMTYNVGIGQSAFFEFFFFSSLAVLTLWVTSFHPVDLNVIYVESAVQNSV